MFSNTVVFKNMYFCVKCEKKLKDKPSVDYKTFIYLVWNFLSIGLNLGQLLLSEYYQQVT